MWVCSSRKMSFCSMQKIRLKNRFNKKTSSAKLCNNFKNSSKPYISPSQAHWSAFVSVSWLRMRSACMTKGVQWRDSHYCHGVTTVSSPCLLLSISRTYSPALVAGAGVSTEWSLVHAYTHAYHPSEPAARPSPFCLPHALQKSLCGCKWSLSHQ